MIRVCTSHRTEVLVATFVERLTQERAVAGPFAPVRLVVPNRHVESYLRLRVAERCGVAANIEASFLRKVLATIVESCLPDVRVADAAHVEGHLLALLHDDQFLTQPVLAQVRGYLDAGGLDRDALDRRRCQLAAILARLFDEYAVSRPQMIEAWAASPAGQEASELELWQRTLWRAVFATGGRLQKQQATTQIRCERLEVLWEQAMARNPPPFAGKTLHVFGLSYVAVAYHRMLRMLARASDVYVYTPSPCRETEGRADEAAASLDDPFGLAGEAHPLVRRWARPGRENLRMLAACPDVTVEAHFPDAPVADSFLHHLQRNLVQRTPPGETTPVPLDGSVRVLPCPSVRRELEVVAAEIWKLARADASLRLCDIAVIVPEASKELYLAQLPPVFRESCDLPHTIADASAGGTHRVAEAMALLLRMPLSTFTRKELVPLLTHPCIMARFPTATAERWRELAQELGIVRGAFRSDLEGSYVTRDLFTWDQGLRRLALGAFVDTSADEATRPLRVGQEAIAPGPGIATDDEEALGFGLLVRSLLADARFAVGNGPTSERLLAEWLELMRGMIGAYVTLDDADTAGKAVVAQFLAKLEELSELGLGDRAVSYRVAAELALRALDELPSQRGQYLAHGVTVASFLPMRALPFRAVFVVGLGQNGFPRASARHELDLRAGRRACGDVDGSEQDLYMFLETLLSAREHVSLSYVARDEITGDELPYSSVLLELRAFLGQGLLTSADVKRLFGADRPALRRYDDHEERRRLLPAAEAEYLAKHHAARGTAAATLAAPRLAPAATTAKLPLPPLSVPIWALRRFLEDPLQGSARFRLGMRDDEDSLVDVEDEPFDMEKGRVTLLMRATLAKMLLEPRLPALDEVLGAYERAAMHVELAGQSPTGLFREATLALEKKLLAGWYDLLPSLLGPDTTGCRRIRFHDGARPGYTLREIVYQPPPVLTVELPEAGRPQRRTVHLAGSTGLCGSSSLLAFTCRAGVSDQGLCREDVGAFLDYAAMTAAGGPHAPAGVRSAVFYVEGGQPRVRVRALRPLAGDVARAYLTDLCTEFLTGSLDEQGNATGIHPYLLPHEAVLESQRNGTAVSDEIAELCAAAGGDRGLFSSLHGPVPAVLARYAPPSESDADAMVRRRFGLLFDLVESGETVRDGKERA